MWHIGRFQSSGWPEGIAPVSRAYWKSEYILPGVPLLSLTGTLNVTSTGI